MMTPIRSWFCVAPAALMAALGCSTTGGQTGEEGQEPCEESAVDIDLDAVSPLGFAPRDLLTTTGDVSTASLRWRSVSELSYGPEVGDSTLTLSLAEANSARYVQSKARTSGELGLMPICADRVEVTVAASVTTSGGALAEQFAATLSASASTNVWLSQLLAPTELAGIFAVDPASLGNRRLVYLSLESRWNGGVMRGHLQVGIEQSSGSGTDSSVSLTIVLLGCFGDDPSFDPSADCVLLQ